MEIKLNPTATQTSKLANKRFFADYLLPKHIVFEGDEDSELMNTLKGIAASIKESSDEKLEEFEIEMKEYLKKVEKGEYSSTEKP